MKELKILILIFLPGFITLIYLYCYKSKVFYERSPNPILNSRKTNAVEYLKQANQKLIPRSVLIIACQIKKFRVGNYTNDTASVIIYTVRMQDCNTKIGSKIFNEEISISKIISGKKRNLNCVLRIVVYVDSSDNLKYKFHFSF
jgi:hypothetical protein